MRAQDRIALCEANPDEREALVAALGRDRRLSIVGTDGYVALNAYLPPKERRGLVLIDPPFEAPDEADARRAGARTRAAQMADRNAHRLAPDPRSPGRFPLSSIRSRRSARRTSCGSNWTSARARSARTARSRSRAPGFSSSTRPIR